MRTLTHLSAKLLPLALVGACGSSPPQLPSADNLTRRPANSALALEVQECRTDLHNSRLSASESAEAAQRSNATLTAISRSVQALSDFRLHTPAQQGNRVYSVLFALGTTRMDIPAGQARALIEDAKSASLVMLRGRTDGAVDTPAERRVARERAAAARDFLVAAGIDPSRIRLTYQATGDHVADNDSESGRALNRRVEIEVYLTAPVSMGGRPLDD